MTGTSEEVSLIEREEAPLVMLTEDGLSAPSSYETKVAPHRRQITVAAYISHATLILTTDTRKADNYRGSKVAA